MCTDGPLAEGTGRLRREGGLLEVGAGCQDMSTATRDASRTRAVELLNKNVELIRTLDGGWPLGRVLLCEDRLAEA